MSARVFLDKTVVGQLTPNVATQTTGFEFDATYAGQDSRPLLGRWFEDHDISPPRRFDGSPLPNYFRNLLPEGALRRVPLRWGSWKEARPFPKRETRSTGEIRLRNVGTRRNVFASA